MGLIALAHAHRARRSPRTPRCSCPPPRRATSSRRWSPSSPTAVFDHFPPGFYVVVVVTALILVLAANTAFNGFPVLGSILAQDRYLPRQLHTRGDRLAFSNGIVVLAAFAIILVIGFQAEVTRLIALYTVGVFTSFTLSQVGMLRHWRRHLATETDPVARRRMRRVTGDQRLRRGDDRRRPGDRADHQVHPRRVDRHRGDGRVLPADDWPSTATTPREPPSSTPRRTDTVLPSRNHAIVLVSTPAPAHAAGARLRAGHPSGRARGGHGQRRRRRHPQARPRVGEAEDPRAAEGRRVAVPGDHQAGAGLRQAGAHPRTRATSSRCSSPSTSSGTGGSRCCTTRARCGSRRRLLFQPGVMVVSVPWQLKSSERVRERTELTPGADRRGYPSAPRDDRPAAPSPSAPAVDGARRSGSRADAGQPRS